MMVSIEVNEDELQLILDGLNYDYTSEFSYEAELQKSLRNRLQEVYDEQFLSAPSFR